MGLSNFLHKNCAKRFQIMTKPICAFCHKMWQSEQPDRLISEIIRAEITQPMNSCSSTSTYVHGVLLKYNFCIIKPYECILISWSVILFYLFGFNFQLEIVRLPKFRESILVTKTKKKFRIQIAHRAWESEIRDSALIFRSFTQLTAQ